MKILHTADWHIGKRLYNQPLSDEMELFFSWLLDLIEEQKIEVVLVAGDIFDLANTSNDDRATYYRVLRKLIEAQVQVIVIGGNHDSVGTLDAPSDILTSMNITVIGGAKENPAEVLIPILDQSGKAVCQVAAIPYLRDSDIRNSGVDVKYSSRVEAIKAGIKNYYEAVRICHRKKNGQLPLIGMGHLYAVGVKASESEREIQIGNEAAVDASIFEGYDYLALGHIHRPQLVQKNEMVRYSGSPISLSFSEREDQKQVIILELSDGEMCHPKPIFVPKFRELKRVKGSLEEIKSKLASLTTDCPLPCFVEVHVQESQFSTALIEQKEQLIQHVNNAEDNSHIRILKSQIQFHEGAEHLTDIYEVGTSIHDLGPIDVFNQRLEIEPLDDKVRENIRGAFLQLLAEVREYED